MILNSRKIKNEGVVVFEITLASLSKDERIRFIIPPINNTDYTIGSALELPPKYAVFTNYMKGEFVKHFSNLKNAKIFYSHQIKHAKELIK